MAVKTKHTFSAANGSTNTFSGHGIELNNLDDLDVYVTLSGGTRRLSLRQSTDTTATSSHPQVNNTDGLYFPAVSVGDQLYNYQLSTANDTITFNNDLPNLAVVTVERRTRDGSGDYTTFAGGSTIRHTDLNRSATESNYTAQEARNKVFEIEGYIFGDAAKSTSFISSDEIIDGTIVGGDIATDTITATNLAANSVGSSELADDSVDTAAIQDNAVTMAKLNSGALPTDITVASANIVDGTIVNADVSNSAAIDHSKLSNISAGNVLLGNSSNVPTSTTLSGDVTVNSSGVTSITAGSIVTADIGADQITNAKIADDQIDSEHYVDGSIDTQHIADLQVTTAKIAADAVTNAKIANDSIDSEHYVDGSIDHQHLANDVIDGDNIQDDVVNSEHIAAGALDNEHYAAGSITSDKLNAATVVINSEQSGASVNDTSFFTTSASDARYFNISSGDTIKDGDTFPDNDTTIATTAAINDRIVDLVDDVGGFVPIANETSFPNANPDVNNGAGTLVSIKALSSNLTSNGSGVATIANGTVGNSTVTITGLDNSTTYNSGFGMIVETTTTLNTYAFHRQVPKATEVTTVAGSISNVNAVAGAISNINSVSANATNVNTVAGNNTNINTVAAANSNINTVASNINDVNNFAELYQISTSAPTQDGGGNSLAVGDLWFDSSSNKALMIYDGSSGDGFSAATPTASVLQDIAIVSGQLTFVEDLGSVGDALTTGTGNNINTVASGISNVNTVAGISSNVTTVAGIASNVTSVAGAVSNINTTVSNLSSINNFAEVYRIASSAPSSSLNEGDLWYDSANNVLKYYNGTNWTVTAAAGLSDLLDDTSPELGGHLDCNNKNLTEVGTVSGDNLQIDFGTLS